MMLQMNLEDHICLTDKKKRKDVVHLIYKFPSHCSFIPPFTAIWIIIIHVLFMVSS